MFLGYSTRSRAYRVFDKMTPTLEESINIVIDDQEQGHKKVVDEPHLLLDDD